MSGDAEEIEENERKRLTYYQKIASLLRAWADYSYFAEEDLTRGEFEALVKEIKYYVEMRDSIKLASGDYIDLKQYEPAMRQLLDNYIHAGESVVLTKLDDFSLIELLLKDGEAFIYDLIKETKGTKDSSSEVIENNVRKKIVEKNPTNPKYFENLSLLLDNLIKARKEATILYEEYLRQMMDLAQKIQNPETEGKYPSSIRTSPGRRALFDNVREDEDFVVKIDEIIRRFKQDSWLGEPTKEKRLKNHIYKYVKDEQLVEEIFAIIRNHREYL